MAKEGGEDFLAPPPAADFVSFPGADGGGAGPRQDLPPIREDGERYQGGSYRSVSAPPALRRENEYTDDDYRAFPDADAYERERT
jgi:hypothetical protein